MGQGPPSTWTHTADGIFDVNHDLVCDALNPMDCDHLECNVGKPKRLVLEPLVERMADVAVELAARWHRARLSLRSDEFTRGRMNGYEQGIALLIKSTQPAVLEALMDGDL